MMTCAKHLPRGRESGQNSIPGFQLKTLPTSDRQEAFTMTLGEFRRAKPVEPDTSVKERVARMILQRFPWVPSNGLPSGDCV